MSTGNIFENPILKTPAVIEGLSQCEKRLSEVGATKEEIDFVISEFLKGVSLGVAIARTLPQPPKIIPPSPQKRC